MTAGRATWNLSTVRSTELVAHDVRRIEFEHPAAAGAAPGSHVDVRIPVISGEVVRSYSVVEATPDGLAITVLRTPHSRGGSEHMHALAAGDHVFVSMPQQDFPLRIGAPRYVLVAGGIGITAVLGMAARLRAASADYDLHYAGAARTRMPYLAQLEALHSDRFEAYVADEGARLDVAALVAGVVSDPLRDAVEVYVCGPLRLMDAVRAAWSAAGLPPANLRFETFGSAGSPDDLPFRVAIPDLGVETVIGADESLLDGLLRAGAPVMYDCLKGECGLCVAEIVAVDGSVDHRDVFLSDPQKAQGRTICLCVSRVTSRNAREPALTLSWP